MILLDKIRTLFKGNQLSLSKLREIEDLSHITFKQ